MKIQGPTPTKSSPSSEIKKGRTDGKFRTLFDAEVADAKQIERSQYQNGEDHPHQHWQLVEEAAELLDQALEQLNAGEKPAEQVIASIQQLRRQLKQTENSDDKSQADTLLAVEAGRIQKLNP